MTIERFVCNIENRMGNKDYEISFGNCDNGMWFDVRDGKSTESLCYYSAAGRVGKTVKNFGQPLVLPASTSVACRWVYAGNYMDGVEVWSEDWLKKQVLQLTEQRDAAKGALANAQATVLCKVELLSKVNDSIRDLKLKLEGL